MDFDLSDEQLLLREAAKNALARTKTVEAARDAIEGDAGPDLWPTAVEAGWTGLIIDEERGGAGLGALDSMLVFAELGRVLASAPLLGHVPATAILEDSAGDAGVAELLGELATGNKRAAYVPARPPSDTEPAWTVDPVRGAKRGAAPSIEVAGDTATVTGTVSWVPDLPGADVLVVVGTTSDGSPAAALIEADASGVTVEEVKSFDATRSLGHLQLAGASGKVLSASSEEISGAWYLAHGLIAAESLGAVETALETSVAYAKERYTFGRAIGSYQAIKHELAEILRQLENSRSLMYYAGWARQDAPDEFPLAASALRSAAGNAIDFASRAQINVHGGIGATWEHDAPLYFRRAQVSRRLLAGTSDATDRVADEVLAAARAEAAAA